MMPAHGPAETHGAAAEGGGIAERLRDLAHLPRDIAFARLGYGLKRPIFSLPIYHYSLGGVSATALEVVPTDPWPGNAEHGAEIADGAFTLAGQRLNQPSPRWAPAGARPEWLAELHGFAWLRDLRAGTGDNARRAARELTGDWLDRHGAWTAPAWDPLITGRRLANWLGCYEFFAASADLHFRHRLLDGIAHQARHLSRVLPAGLAGADLIAAVKGLIYAGVCLPGGETWRARGLAILKREIPRQVLADGGHAERCPSRHLAVLRDLIDLRAALHKGKPHADGASIELRDAIDSMAPVLRMFQHGDRGLALFNGSNEEDGLQVDMVLQRAGNRRRALNSAPESGFQCMRAGRTAVIVDTGDPPPPGLDAHAHAGTFALEVSVGRERLIVNCGARVGDPAWQWAQRASAAHSTLVLNDTNSSVLAPGHGIGRRSRVLYCRREGADNGIWLDMSQNGYEPAFGVIHRRRLYLNPDGTDLRGEDRLETRGRGRARGGTFALRFHLHPEVQASLARGGDSVLLRLPKGGGWQLRTAGAAADLEQSIYLGRGGEIRRSRQIVFSGETGADGVKVKWALRRIERKRA